MEQFIRPICAPYGLTSMHVRLLMELSDGDLHSVGDISRCLRLAKTNASSLCKKLEADGYLSRARDYSDERVVLVTLTEKGRSTLDEISEQLEGRCSQVMSQLSREDMAKIVEGMSTLGQVMSLLCDPSGSKEDADNLAEESKP